MTSYFAKRPNREATVKESDGASSTAGAVNIALMSLCHDQRGQRYSIKLSIFANICCCYSLESFNMWCSGASGSSSS